MKSEAKMLTDVLSEGLENYRIGPKIRSIRTEKSLGLSQCSHSVIAQHCDRLGGGCAGRMFLMPDGLVRAANENMNKALRLFFRSFGFTWGLEFYDDHLNPGLNKWVVRPLQKSLPLARSTENVCRFAICSHLARVSCERAPSLDLNFIGGNKSATQEITTVPLKPPSGIRVNYPSPLAPDSK